MMMFMNPEWNLDAMLIRIAPSDVPGTMEYLRKVWAGIAPDNPFEATFLDEDFQKQVGKRDRAKTKAAEIEHAIRHHLDVELDDDPDLQASFAAALKAIFEQFRDNWRKIYEELESLRARIRSACSCRRSWTRSTASRR